MMATERLKSAMVGRLSGAGFLALVGGVAIYQASGLPLGTLAQMGPGFYPLGLGILLVALGVAVFFLPARESTIAPLDGPKVSVWTDIRAWLLIIGSVVAFMVLGDAFGLVVSTFAMTFIASLADRGNSVRVALALASFMTVLGAVVFHFLLEIQFPLFRSPF